MGEDQERALDAVFRDATAAVLVEVARRVREVYADTRVAEALVDFSPSAE